MFGDLGHGWGYILAKTCGQSSGAKQGWLERGHRWPRWLVAHCALRPPGGPKPRAPCRGRKVPSASMRPTLKRTGGLQRSRVPLTLSRLTGLGVPAQSTNPALPLGAGSVYKSWRGVGEGSGQWAPEKGRLAGR